MTYPVVTADLSRFGPREIGIAAELLQALVRASQSPTIDRRYMDGLTINMNVNRGYVFLSDDDCNRYMMNGDQLEQFLCSPYGGHEGFYDELIDEYEDMHFDDQEWLRDHAQAYNLAMSPAMIADAKGVSK